MGDRIRRLIATVDRWSLRHRWLRVGRHAVSGFIGHEALQYAGSMAYFAVLSIFQLLVLGVVVFSLFVGQGQARQFVIDQVSAGSPIDPKLISTVIDSVIKSRGGISVVGFLLLMWSALGIFSALNTGIARAFGSPQPRPFLKDKLVGLFLIFVTGLLTVASVVTGILTGIVQGAAGTIVSSVPGGAFALSLIGLLVPLLLIFAAILVMYRIVPNRKVSFAEVLPGAVVAALLWSVLRVGFTYYATHIANYKSAFGPISTGISLLVFLYFANLVLLLGAEVARANVLEDEPATAAPSPVQRAAAQSTPSGASLARPPRKRRLPGWLAVLGAAVAGVVAGRLTNRRED
ncbi:MAG: YihY/virulence factor BrkB family protein [Chloroflexota bacterium]|nr:YihY/virulence factor BrkB family protein [Chloroflexota bacterium]